MILFFYRIFFLPCLFTGLVLRLRKLWYRGGHGLALGNRFGRMRHLPDKPPGLQRVWIQAASVGELMALQSLLQKLKRENEVEVVLTTNTSTGYRIIRDKLSDMVSWYGLFPFDFWLFSRKAWESLRPDLMVLVEGELWPEHLHQAARRSVPVLLVNARMSDRSFHRHNRLKWLTQGLHRSIDLILAGSYPDQQRFQDLGWIESDKVHWIGNLKLDVELPESPETGEREKQLSEFGLQDSTALVLLGSSTWPGEELALVEAYQRLKPLIPSLFLVLVPRHAERKPKIQEALEGYGLKVHFRSESKTAAPRTSVYVADTTGELGRLTCFADVVFIGKSLPPNVGGQSPVEAAAAGKPMLFGPEMSNFRDISRQLLESDAAIRLDSVAALEPALRTVLMDRERCQRMGTAARQCIERNRGASRRAREWILTQLSLSPEKND